LSDKARRGRGGHLIHDPGKEKTAGEVQDKLYTGEPRTFPWEALVRK